MLEHEQLMRTNNFFCGLYFLVGLADAAEATLKLRESTIDENCTVLEHIVSLELLAKLFTIMAEQAGCSTYFRAYLRHEGINKIPLTAFRGNRFNILFYDAAGVFFF